MTFAHPKIKGQGELTIKQLTVLRNLVAPLPVDTYIRYYRFKSNMSCFAEFSAQYFSSYVNLTIIIQKEENGTFFNHISTAGSPSHLSSWSDKCSHTEPNHATDWQKWVQLPSFACREDVSTGGLTCWDFQPDAPLTVPSCSHRVISQETTFTDVSVL